MTSVAVAMTESASLAAGVWLRGAAGIEVVVAGGAPSPWPGPGRPSDRESSLSGRFAFRPPPRLKERPAASSNPSRRSSDISRQRDSTPTRRNEAGWSSYPSPADQLVQVLENERECGEPIPAPTPATT